MQSLKHIFLSLRYTKKWIYVCYLQIHKMQMSLERHFQILKNIEIKLGHWKMKFIVILVFLLAK